MDGGAIDYCHKCGNEMESICKTCRIDYLYHVIDQLKDFAEHEHECPKNPHSGFVACSYEEVTTTTCTCGLTDLLSQP